MITKEMMERYKEFDGDLDKWVRSQRSGMDGILSGSEWTLIDKAVQRLKLEKNGSASRDYREETERVLKKTFENPEVIRIARSMA